jgi:hypothetical protein
VITPTSTLPTAELFAKGEEEEANELRQLSSQQQVRIFTEGPPYYVDKLIDKTLITPNQQKLLAEAREKESVLSPGERFMAGLKMTERGEIDALRKRLGPENVEPIINKDGSLETILVRRSTDEPFVEADPADIQKLGDAGFFESIGITAKELAGDIADVGGLAIRVCSVGRSHR